MGCFIYLSVTDLTDFFINFALMEQFLKDRIEEIAFVQVDIDDMLWTDRILDSITIVELIVELEGEYGIEIPMVDVVEENFNSVRLIMAYLERLKA
jgi:acyl carrier protein